MAGTIFFPPSCELSRASCSSALNVTDGRALAANALNQEQSGEATTRYPCNGAIVERKYEPKAARAMRDASCDLRV